MNNRITILLHNMGIDKWVNNFDPDISVVEKNNINIVDYIKSAKKSDFIDVNDVLFYDKYFDNYFDNNIKYSDIKKGISKNQIDFMDKSKTIRYYSTYVNNKQFDYYLNYFYKEFVKYINNNNIDICIFQEFCSRLWKIFNFDNKLEQLYETPLNSYSDCLPFMSDSRKSFLIGSSKYEINDIHNIIKKTIEFGYLEKIPFQIGFINHNGNNIVFVNVHNRISITIYEILLKLTDILDNIGNVIILGDFNIVNFTDTEREKFRKKGYDICDNYGLDCNLKSLYWEINKCDEKNKKFKLINILCKLKNYDIILENLECNFNTNVSSHIPVKITLVTNNNKIEKKYIDNKYVELINYNDNYHDIADSLYRDMKQKKIYFTDLRIYKILDKVPSFDFRKNLPDVITTINVLQR